MQMLNNYEIRPGRFIGVCVSLNNCRLFIGSIPEVKSKDEIMEAMKEVRTPPAVTQLLVSEHKL